MANRISLGLTVAAGALLVATEYFYGLTAAQAAFAAIMVLGLAAVWFAPELRRITGGAQSAPSAGRDGLIRPAAGRPRGRLHLL